jgi:hypothetical protein
MNYQAEICLPDHHGRADLPARDRTFVSRIVAASTEFAHSLIGDQLKVLAQYPKASGATASVTPTEESITEQWAPPLAAWCLRNCK